MGDYNGDGRLDLISGSNCCAPEAVHLLLRNPDGSFADRQDITFERPDVDQLSRAIGRGTTRPHLVDWNRDGETDLVIGYAGWKLYVSPGPLSGKTRVDVRPVSLPEIPGGHPFYFGFADWDQDGQLDLLVSMQHRGSSDDPFTHQIAWLRNTSKSGEPEFAPPRPLLSIPDPWKVEAFTTVDWDRNGRLDLVVSQTKDWKRIPNVGWSVDSQLWLYRAR